MEHVFISIYWEVNISSRTWSMTFFFFTLCVMVLGFLCRSCFTSCLLCFPACFDCLACPLVWTFFCLLSLDNSLLPVYLVCMFSLFRLYIYFFYLRPLLLYASMFFGWTRFITSSPFVLQPACLVSGPHWSESKHFGNILLNKITTEQNLTWQFYGRDYAYDPISWMYCWTLI